MKFEIKLLVYMFILGLSLAAYAHNNFATKFTINNMMQDIREIRSMVSDIHKAYDK